MTYLVTIAVTHSLGLPGVRGDKRVQRGVLSDSERLDGGLHLLVGEDGEDIRPAPLLVGVCVDLLINLFLRQLGFVLLVSAGKAEIVRLAERGGASQTWRDRCEMR